METLQIGDQGPTVVVLQLDLQKKGKAVVADGDFGPQTLAAVQAFQKSAGLTIDGVVGPLTWAALTGVSPANQSVKGLDVSHYQGQIDWNQVYAAGYFFMSAKATEGVSVVDDTFAYNWAQAKAAGFIRSAYHFFHPSEDPTAQANNFLAQLGSDFGELPVALDWEVHEGTIQQELDNALIWLDIVEKATGRKPFLYSYCDYFNDLGNASWFANYPLWIAAYTSAPVIPAPWTSYVLWQNLGDANVTVSGMPASAKDFDLYPGSLAQLQAYAKG
jgi:lysozyme